MQISQPTGDTARLQQYATQLVDARAQLASLRSTDVASPAQADRALTALHGACATIYRGITELGPLPAGIPSGAISHAREGAGHVSVAIGEVSRSLRGAAIDAQVVNHAVDAAMGKLAAAHSLVLHPPTDVVYDGS